ncbi:uncharacterized protein Thert_00995 [Thermoanaerobacterium thermosaccharolyticum]|uniref:Sulfatase N-terminal domain-containing protein n=2 Tax=Thermoanaerobacterium thermosaccharolyticum TaxID=1517 RepID=A0A223HX99_THETR|nr:sulfatase-like hydrolase/transferase [Thermoanaerobacterium thermosaccharolyticum]AST57110.1 uncharacterized protein Thert_00995 [Thermoanaerobacterium thermosaccharolyticum]
MKCFPNIIYFFCDELRADALNCYNPGRGLQTPNIDFIAERGIRYDSCYCNSPVCVPSRASILTGLYPKDMGVYHNEAAYPPFKLHEQYETIPSILRRYGYKTASFGKIHLPNGMFSFEFINEEGSEMHMGLNLKMDLAIKILPRGGFRSILGSTYPPDREYYPGRVTRNALDYMKNQKKPYFIRISYLQPHTPIIVPKPFDTLYENIFFDSTIKVSDGLSRFEKRFAEIVDAGTLTPDEIRMIKVYYYGLVAWIDSQVGYILDYLKSGGEIEDTVIIIGADHGALRGENGGLGKQTFHYTAHRFPLIIYYPPKIPMGRVEDKICENLDLGPTLFHLLNIETPSQFKGMNLLQKLEDHEVYAEIGFGEKTSYAFPNKRYGRYYGDRGWP